MNKRDLIDAISGRLGDRKSATEAVNAVLETIQSAVAAGDKVAITGFGVFEKSERPARTARNPATGATIQVPKSLCAEVPPGRRLQGPRQRREARPELASAPRPETETETETETAATETAETETETETETAATAATAAGGDPAWTPPAAVLTRESRTRNRRRHRGPGRLRSAVWMIRSMS